jgi:hypothetical protein
MLKTRLIQGVLSISILLSGCVLTRPTPQALPTPSKSWTVKLTQSGGFAGVLLIIEVSSDGHLNAQDERAQRSVAQTLSDETIARMSSLISNTKLSRGAVPSSGCADCFIYDLEIRSDGQVVEGRVDDVTIGDSGAADLIAFLRELRDAALRSHP